MFREYDPPAHLRECVRGEKPIKLLQQQSAVSVQSRQTAAGCKERTISCWGARILAKPSLRENLGMSRLLIPHLHNSQSAIINPQFRAGVPGFEPGNDGSKGRCLTTWLHPSFFETHDSVFPPVPCYFSGNPIKKKAQFVKNRAKNIPKKGFGVNPILRSFWVRKKRKRIDEIVVEPGPEHTECDVFGEQDDVSPAHTHILNICGFGDLLRPVP